MNNIYKNPSFYAHVINCISLLFAFVILYRNYTNIIILEPFQLIMLILLFSISIGIHSLSHLGLEKGYGYNPMHILK